MLGRGELDEVTDGPREDVAVAAQVAVCALRGAEHAREIAGNRGFFGDDDDHGGARYRLFSGERQVIACDTGE